MSEMKDFQDMTFAEYDQALDLWNMTDLSQMQEYGLQVASPCLEQWIDERYLALDANLSRNDDSSLPPCLTSGYAVLPSSTMNPVEHEGSSGEPIPLLHRQTLPVPATLRRNPGPDFTQIMPQQSKDVCGLRPAKSDRRERCDSSSIKSVPCDIDSIHASIASNSSDVQENPGERSTVHPSELYLQTSERGLSVRVISPDHLKHDAPPTDLQYTPPSDVTNTLPLPFRTSNGSDIRTKVNIQLASKSNYEYITTGQTVPGLSYPKSFLDSLTSKKASHKIAEQTRRDRFNKALKELDLLLQSVPACRDEEGSEASAKASKDASKALVVEKAAICIKNLEDELAIAQHKLWSIKEKLL